MAVGLDLKTGVSDREGGRLPLLSLYGDAKLEDEEEEERDEWARARFTFTVVGGGTAYRGRDSSGLWRMKPTVNN